MPLETTKLTSFGMIMRERKTIPAYQRDFVWDDNLTSSFLENILDAYKEGKENYFCGSIVMYKNTDGVYEIVDGQQRATVLYMLACQLIPQIGEYNRNSDYSGEQRAAYVYTSNGASEESRIFHFSHRNITVGSCYKSIGLGNGITEEANESDDALLANLKDCESQIVSFIEDSFAGSEIMKMEVFYKYLLEKVRFTVFIAEEMDEALSIYSRLNSGGKALGHLEIIKGKLFESINNAEKEKVDELEQIWNKFWVKFKTPIRVGNKGNAKNFATEDTFLAYYFLSNNPSLVNSVCGTTDGFLPTKRIAEYLLDDRVKSQVFSRPQEFLESLSHFMDLMVAMRTGTDDESEVANYLEDIALLSQSQTQPLMFLLRARLKDKDLFKSVLPITMGLVFIFTLSVTGTGSTSKVWRSLTRVIEENKNAPIEDLKEYVDFAARAQFREYWKSNFVPFSHNLSISKQKYKIKILLLINEIAARNLASHPEKRRYSDYYKLPGFDVDHLEPEGLSSEEHIQKLGNAAILGASANRAVKKKPFNNDQKQNALSESELLTTRAVVQNEDLARGATKNVVNKFSTIVEINDACVLTREEEILKCIRQFFDPLDQVEGQNNGR